MNDPLRNCPRCTKKNCNHDERLWANILAEQIGTGVMNMDVSYRWVGSQRALNRVVIIELKRQYDPFPTGQELCLKDLTGTLTTLEGLRFELRSFFLERVKDSFNLMTFLGNVRELSLTFVREGTAFTCAQVIRDWYINGTIPKPAPIREKAYLFLDIDECRRQQHSFELAGSPKTPMKVNLVCRQCSDRLNKTAYVAFGEPAQSFGDWVQARERRSISESNNGGEMESLVDSE